MSSPVLVLWDIDRTLLYVGNTDRLIYRELAHDLLGHPAQHLPAKGTGRTVPLAVRELLQRNGAPEADLDALVKQALQELPDRLDEYRSHMLEHGHLLPGAAQAVEAVHAHPGWVPSVVTGNLQRSAQIKLEAFGLAPCIDTALGGYSSDDPHRPHLVARAQQRAQAALGTTFDRTNTVIIGDSLEDVTTGVEGGAQVIGVASGTTPAQQLHQAGADRVLADLTQVEALKEAITALSHVCE
ncbi:haloacid dehalogenase-like hydrolase [Nocardiopsis exhalans]|uniref:Haloacid dehalogenase-like hydrolase n=1 Tax=Nocardiopsis exhalans TaxID=163604 RepID=A0ABY5D119_9ACTN|nr:haloacid dehalogenase-like hydrolase [Nocardiopsis exhalans]USY18032.1 haloacid dehalogenase-like hydrolase [Nocardiopsis exhalans]